MRTGTSENAGGQFTSYSWDADNRMVGVAYPSGAPDTMSYSNNGLRQNKVTAAGTTGFVWDQQNVLIETAVQSPTSQVDGEK